MTKGTRNVARIIGGSIDGHTNGEDIRFVSLDSLARRAGGRNGYWQIEYPTMNEPRWTVMLLEPARHGNGSHVRARVRVDAQE